MLLQRHLAVLTLASVAVAQGALPEPLTREVIGEGGAKLPYLVQLPSGFTAEQWRQVVVLLRESAGDATATRERVLQASRAIARRGMVVVCPEAIAQGPTRSAASPLLARLPTELRQRFKIASGGMHLVGIDRGVEVAFDLATTQAWEFRAMIAVRGGLSCDAAALARLRGRSVAWFTSSEVGSSTAGLAQLQTAGITVVNRAAVLPEEALGEALATQVVAWSAASEPTGAEAAVARVLDEFHDAAAKGDAERYFAILPDDAVFLGTDATERWTGAAFRKFALPYFERGPAWTYVPMRRNVTLAPDGKLAWFDEMLDNAAYGECRGSGVLQQRDGRWVVRQYNLTIPVPNDLARGLVARIRAFAEGRAPAVTTVVVVRHGEKGEGTDPDLTEAGKTRASVLVPILCSLPVAAIYTSEFRRTKAMMEPLCSSRKLEAKVMAAADAKGLAAKITKEHLGKTVVVAGHSNTVPALLKALGVVEAVKIDDSEFDRLFVVTLGPDGARLLDLHYGKP